MCENEPPPPCGKRKPVMARIPLKNPDTNILKKKIKKPSAKAHAITFNPGLLKPNAGRIGDAFEGWVDSLRVRLLKTIITTIGMVAMIRIWLRIEKPTSRTQSGNNP